MRVAAIQMVSSSDVDENLTQAKFFIEHAAEAKQADIILFPENFLTFGSVPDGFSNRQQQIIETLRELARKNNIWLICGTLPLTMTSVQTEKADILKPHATCVVIDRLGEVRSHYDKVHLFDAEVNDATGRYSESALYNAGSEIGVFESEWGTFGLAVCYDLRFPEYFRLLSERGIKAVFVPAAFTYITGRAHWEVLVRARAIENQFYLIAACQGGQHTPTRRTWGGTMVVDPWGDILAKLDEGKGVICVDVDLSRVDQVRRKMPVLTNRRF